MILSDRHILEAMDRAELGITPFDRSALQPSSVDITLGTQIRTTKPTRMPVDMAKVEPGYSTLVDLPAQGRTMHPREFWLATTAEEVWLGQRLAARVEGKSSVGRVGLAIHVTAGFIDPGFRGQVTLEMVNLAPFGIRIYPGMPIAQLAIFSMSGPPLEDYTKTGRYNGQTGPTESRYALPDPAGR